jgi:hypothetical protein
MDEVFLLILIKQNTMSQHLHENNYKKRAKFNSKELDLPIGTLRFLDGTTQNTAALPASEASPLHPQTGRGFYLSLADDTNLGTTAIPDWQVINTFDNNNSGIYIVGGGRAIATVAGFYSVAFSGRFTGSSQYLMEIVAFDGPDPTTANRLGVVCAGRSGSHDMNCSANHVFLQQNWSLRWEFFSTSGGQTRDFRASLTFDGIW